MNGIRINNSGQKEAKIRVLDYDFTSIIESIKEKIVGLYWVLEDVNFSHIAKDGSEFSDYQNNFPKLIVGNKGICKLANVNFVIDYSKFFIGDNDRIIGIKSPYIFENADSFGVDFVEVNGQVFFNCIDRLFWEVYSIDDSLLEKIKMKFPNSEFCSLSNTW